MFMNDRYIILNNIEEYKKFELVIYTHDISFNYINWLFVKGYISFPLILYGNGFDSIDTTSHPDLQYVIKDLNLIEILLEDVLKY